MFVRRHPANADGQSAQRPGLRQKTTTGQYSVLDLECRFPAYRTIGDRRMAADATPGGQWKNECRSLENPGAVQGSVACGQRGRRFDGLCRSHYGPRKALPLSRSAEGAASRMHIASDLSLHLPAPSRS